MKPIIKKITLYFLAITMVSTLFGGSIMKLVNKNTDYVVVEFNDGKATFNDKYFELMFKERGIVVPPAKQKEFQNKRVIFLNDPLFEKAFREIFYPHAMDRSTYQWKEETNKVTEQDKQD